MERMKRDYMYPWAYITQWRFGWSKTVMMTREEQIASDEDIGAMHSDLECTLENQSV